jgi:hypothetical protein
VGFQVIDATLSIEEQQRRMREIVMNVLGDSLKNGILHQAAGGDSSAQATTAPVL